MGACRRAPQGRDAEPMNPPLLPDLAAFLDSLPEPHILFDDRYRIVQANAAYRRRFAPAGSVVGRTCYEVSHHYDRPCDEAGESCPMARARMSGQRERVLHLHHTPQGEEYVNVELLPLRDAAGQRWFVEKMEPLPATHGQPVAQGLIGRAPAFRAMLAQVARAAPSTASVLLLGESGTGKELVARALHEASARAAHPLVVVDCASLPETLFESELFGHEKGAFTGAHATRPGLVEAASGGTLFLDEVGDIPPTVQVKLLRLLESGTFRRVGSTELRRADLRVVSATHRDLAAMVADGRFRQDLFYRLATFPIRLPPLRERREDLPLLAEALLARVAPGRRLVLAPAALDLLQSHAFPGNVRELRNVLERAALLTDGERIDAVALREALGTAVGMPALAIAGRPAAGLSGATAPIGTTPAPAGAPPAAMPSLRALEDQTLRARLASHRGTRAELARSLGLSERTLYRRLQALGRGEHGGG
jgi:two-component system, NtrC family, response regulator HydG